MKRRVVTIALAAAAVGAMSGASAAEPARTAAPAGFHEARSLEPAASYVARKPVQVMCANTAASWRAAVSAAPGVVSEANGLAYPGAAVLEVSDLVCGWLDGVKIHRRLPIRSQWRSAAASIQTLTHEAIHLRGESDEGITDCAAMHEMPDVAVRFFYVKSGAELRGLMADAWALHRAEPVIYRTAC